MLVLELHAGDTVMGVVLLRGRNEVDLHIAKKICTRDTQICHIALELMPPGYTIIYCISVYGDTTALVS